MKINESTTVVFNIDKTRGQYVSIKKRGNVLVVNSSARKPRGGAKTTLEKIEKMIEVIDMNETSRQILAQAAKEISLGYAKKNKNQPIFHKRHSKKVQALAGRIFHLTTVPEIPVEVFGIMGKYLDLKTLGRLTQVGSRTGHPLGGEWIERAKAIGYQGEDAKAAKAFCKNFITCTRTMGFLCHRWISNPTLNLHVNKLNTFLNNFFPRPISDYEPFLHFLVQKTKVSEFPLIELESVKNFIRNMTGKQLTASTIFPMAELMVNFQAKANLSWFTEVDISKKDAITILDLLKRNDLNFRDVRISSRVVNDLDYVTPLYHAVAHNHLGWVQALIEKKADPNAVSHVSTFINGIGKVIKPIRPIEIAVENKNTEIISFLIKSKAQIPLDQSFINYLIKNNPPNQVMMILNRLQEEHYGLEETLLNQAIMADQPQEVLEKMVEMGAKINPVKRSESPLLYAQKHKKMQAAVWLMEQGASVPAKRKLFS